MTSRIRAFVSAATLLALGLHVPAARADVTRLEVTSRTDIGHSGYEKIVGTAHLEVDPQDPANRVIADLDKAPVNARGRVEFSTDIVIVAPKDQSRSNGVALLDVVNRGNKTIMRFSRATSSAGDNEGSEPVPCPAGGATAQPPVADFGDDASLGDGFLTGPGYTLVFVGWQADIRRTVRAMSIDVPRAKGVSGVVTAEFTPCDARESRAVADLRMYPASDAKGADTVLTVRDLPFADATTVPREKYTIEGSTVRMAGGFEKGRIYRLSYRTADPPIIGLGLAAFRDVAAWLKHAPDAPVHPRYAYVFGSSQSGRFLRTFLYQGFNTDTHGAQVFDAVWAHIAGAARLDINERFGTPNALLMFGSTHFPYAVTAQRDPLTGKTDGLLDNDRARKNQPKLFLTNTAVEYWGGGRSAALNHTTADGKADLAPPPNVRIYYLAGTQHSPGRFPPKAITGQQPVNPVDYWHINRALFVALDKWVREGTEPPASQYPKLSDGTLVPASRVAFPPIPGVHSPKAIPPARTDGKALPLLVPQVDADGNDRVGIRLPEITVPVATYTGWNFRTPVNGGPDLLVDLVGSAIPLPATAADAQARKDPRRPVAARYASRDAYLAKAREAAEGLVKAGYLLQQDVEPVMKRMQDQWELVVGR